MPSQSYIKKNFSLAWPLALNGLLMQSMLMIDTFLVSPLGEVPLAAMGISTAIIASILGIQMALANGSQLVLSRAVGSGNQASLSKAFISALLINCATALFFWILLTLFDTPIIHAITDNVLLHGEIEEYLSIAKYLVLYTAITQVIIALFNSLRKSKIPFTGYLIELPVNALLSYLFIHGYQFTENLSVTGMGVQGAAMGSIIAITIRMIYLIFSIRASKEIVITLPNKDASMLRNIRLHMIEIFPVAGNVLILAIGITIYQLIYSQLEINAYVAITLMMPWIRAGTQFITAWSHATAITISQAIGARKMDDLSVNVDKSIDIAVLMSVACAIVFAAVSLVIEDIYPDLDTTTYQALTIIAPLYIFLPIVRGYNTVHGNVLRAMGKTTAVFKINFTGQWIISIPLCALIVIGLDGSIFWAFAIQPFEEIIKALPFRHLARKSLREFNQEKADQLMHD